jgi:copper chaperone CopZ
LSDAAASLPAADASLSAFHLLDVTGYTTALGEPATALEDDGGIPDPTGGHRSVARVAATSGAVYTVALHSAANEADARSEFQRLAANGDPSSSSLTGAGDEAAFAGGKTVVRKGAQVLTIGTELTAAAQKVLEQIKESGGDAGAAQAALEAKTVALAAPLAARLSGQSAPDPVLGLPQGAVDPCFAGAVDILKKVYGVSSVESSYQLGDAPAIACLYRMPGVDVPIEVTTVTDEQLAASLTATTSAGRFNDDAGSNGSGASTADIEVSPLEEYNAFLATDPFGWIIHLDFPGRSQKCPTPEEIAKGREFIDEALDALRDSMNARQRNTPASELQRRADEYQRLAEDYKAQADQLRSQASLSSCR